MIDLPGFIERSLFNGPDADEINLLQQQYGGYGQSNPYEQGQGAGNPYAQQTGNTYSESAPSQGAYGNGGGGAYGESRPDPPGTPTPPIDCSIL